VTIHFVLNGKPVSCNISPHRRLLDVLREDFGLIGTKEACGRGECGSCTVLLNGVRVNSCLIPAMQMEGARVTTIEGVREWPVFESIARAFIENGSVQCGYCIPGYVISTLGVLCELPHDVAMEDIRRALAGNLCRCTGYDKILKAVEDLAEDGAVRAEIQQWVERERV
jgi:aerobic-type carbon monoxide dehydrogenase small subunit (CoxS/CutS family)